MTSERIADDIEAFQSSGGHIEVLGVTRVLKKLDETTPSQETTSPQIRPSQTKPTQTSPAQPRTRRS